MSHRVKVLCACWLTEGLCHTKWKRSMINLANYTCVFIWIWLPLWPCERAVTCHPDWTTCCTFGLQGIGILPAHLSDVGHSGLHKELLQLSQINDFSPWMLIFVLLLFFFNLLNLNNTKSATSKLYIWPLKTSVNTFLFYDAFLKHMRLWYDPTLSAWTFTAHHLTGTCRWS